MKNTKKHYDVIIIGAGPAGLRCAEVLLKSNKKILLVERKKEIGAKICAGGLTRKSIEYLKKMNFPENLIESRFSSVIFRKGNLKTKIDFKKDFVHTISRKNLGVWQLKRIQNRQNIDIITNTSATKIDKDFVILNNKHKVTYNYLVGADSTFSSVRKFLNIETKIFGIAFQYILKNNKKYNDLELFLDSKSFFALYAWIFPHSSTVSIGSGFFPQFSSLKKSMEKFHTWTQKENVNLNNQKVQVHPINFDYRGYNFGNVFLIGDAAGTASGFTGEGIYQALVFGEEIAKTILDKKYKSKLIPKLLRKKYLQETLLVLLIISGPFRDIVFYFIVIIVKIPWCGRTLLRLLS